jgi:hemerythrin-like domain-containing protein
MKREAVSLIKSEHRCLAAVIDAMMHVVRKTRSAGTIPDFRLLHVMLYYIREFPERRHHPSEDSSLFALLMQRTNEADEIIRELEAEHDEGEAMLGMLTVALSTWEAGRADGIDGFVNALKHFSEFYWRHMDKEENKVLPIAEKILSEEDWNEIERTFSAHADPLLGKEKSEDFDALLSEIVRVTPAPIGLGDPEL